MPVPITLTVAPGRALVGETVVMVGAAAAPRTVKVAAGVVAVPRLRTTFVAPEAAPKGTLNVKPVAVTSLIVTPVVPNVSEGRLVKPVPVAVTLVPGGPLVGVRLAITGPAPTVNEFEVIETVGASSNANLSV